MTLIKILLASLISLSFAGCLFQERIRTLLTLKQLGDSQKEIQSYLERQEALFNKLVADIKEGKLQAGISQAVILSSYGEPVVLKKSPQFPAETIFLYRHPTEYFNTDKVYLYFDQSGRLRRWEYKPRQKLEITNN